MNLAITLGRKGTSWTVIRLPHEGTVSDHVRAFHGLTVDQSLREKFDEIQVWTQVGGRVKRRVMHDTDGQRVRTAEELLALDAAAKAESESKSESTPAPAPEAVKPPVNVDKKSAAKGKKGGKAVATEPSAESLLS